MEIYTGKDDSILRRMVVSLGIVAPKNSSSPNGSADFKLDFSISDLNEDQEISEPSSAEAVRASSPRSSAASALGGLGGGSSSGSSSGSGSSGSGTAANNAKLEKYSKCVTDAGADTTKARKCADLLPARRPLRG